MMFLMVFGVILVVIVFLLYGLIVDFFNMNLSVGYNMVVGLCGGFM